MYTVSGAGTAVEIGAITMPKSKVSGYIGAAWRVKTFYLGASTDVLTFQSFDLAEEDRNASHYFLVRVPK